MTSSVEQELYRIASFSACPPNGKTSDLHLARKGFYYSEGKILCYKCGGELHRRWISSDDIIERHKKASPGCQLQSDTPLLRPKTDSGSPDVQEQASRTVSRPTVGTFSFEPREIKARMDTAKVRTILRMGYNKDLIKKALEIQLTTNGDDFPNAESLLEAIFALQDEITSQTSTIPLSEFSTTTLSDETSCSNGNTAPSEVPLHTSESHVPSSGQTSSSSTASCTSRDAPEYADQNRRLREAITCKNCMAAEVNIVFLPCGHLVCCDKCSPLMSSCPICRTPIKGTVKTFLS